MTKPGLSAEFQPGLGVLRAAPLSAAAQKSLADIRARKDAEEAATKKAAGKTPIKAPIAELGVDPGMADKIGKVIQQLGTMGIQLMPGGTPAIKRPISNFGGF